jgi:hypothetical protein
MPTKLIEIEGAFVEVEVSPDQAQQISGGLADKVCGSFEQIQPLLVKACRPILAAWKEINQDMNIEQAEVELGLGFEGEGNIYVTKAKANANLTVKLTLKPKQIKA